MKQQEMDKYLQRYASSVNTEMHIINQTTIEIGMRFGDYDSPVFWDKRITVTDVVAATRTWWQAKASFMEQAALDVQKA